MVNSFDIADENEEADDEFDDENKFDRRYTINLYKCAHLLVVYQFVCMIFLRK